MLRFFSVGRKCYGFSAWEESVTVFQRGKRVCVAVAVGTGDETQAAHVDEHVTDTHVNCKQNIRGLGLCC